MAEVTDEPANRNARRRSRTRAALIRAAQEILIEGGDEGVSIQALTDRADVGFGSFYNHFASKTELFAAAYAETFEAYVAWRDAQIPADADPIARFAMSVRLTGRLGLRRPDLAGILAYRVAEVTPGDPGPDGPGLREALLDVLDVLRPGDPDLSETEVTVIAAAGAISAVLRVLAHRAAQDHARLADGLARDLLRMLGVDEQHIASLLTAPCPPDMDSVGA